MKLLNIMGLVAIAALCACSPSVKEQEEANNFKPYIYNEQEALPDAYPKTPWQYPAGTSTQEIVKRWKAAGLVMGMNTDKKGTRRAVIGPQFYNLSQSSQRGLADAIGQMYGASHYFLVDVNTKRVVGQYTPQGLGLY